MKQQLIFLFVAMLVATFPGMSQESDFEMFKRQQQRDIQQYVSDRDSVLSLLNKDFDQYIENRNREYAEYLQKEWEQFETFQGIAPESDPKPEEIPSYEPQDRQNKARKISNEAIEAIAPAVARITPRQKFREPITLKPVDSAAPSIPTSNINFYGRQLSIAVDRSFIGIRAYGNEEKDISDWFVRAANTNFTPTLIDLLDIAYETGMNDWALYMAAKELGLKLASNDKEAAKLYTWFMLMQAGFDIRLGKQQQDLVLLMPFPHIVYSTPRLDLDNKTFYLIDGNAQDPIYTYKQTMPGAFRLFDMNFYKSPTFALSGKNKDLTFEHDGRQFTFTMQYDPVLVAMLAEQPQADMNIYLDADASNYTIQASEKALEPILENMNAVEKVSFLLKLSQTAFDYQTDIEQFGWQKYMVPDEVIHYDYSDCDDRAVFFGWLVRNYAAQQVAALLYPGHLATAVHFEGGNPAGDYVVVDGKKFVVADPTYINAPIGLTMPDFSGVAPTAWLIDNQRYIHHQNLAVWDKLMLLGARRGNNQKDMIIEEDDVFTTGYFSNSLKHPNSRIRLENYGEKRTAFVGRFNKDLQPEWLHAFQADGDATGFSIIKASNGNLIVAGSFTGRLTIQGKSVESEEGEKDAFIASFRPSGQLLWVINAGLNTSHNNHAMAYSLHLSLNGETSEVHYYNDPRDNISGLYPDGEDRIVLSGTFGTSSGLTSDSAPISANAASLGYADMLIQKNKELIQQRDIESTIAGLFAAIYLSKSEGAVFPGSAAQEAILKANPRFTSQFPETYTNIGKISFLRNKSGIIEIRTENEQDVFFDKMRIRNGSTMRVRTMPGGDEQIDILSNIHVGQMVVWYPLNFIRLNRRSGDLLFDYRSNNSQVTLNLKKDILN